MPSPFTREDLDTLHELLGDRSELIRDLEDLSRQHKAGIYHDGDTPYVMGPVPRDEGLLRDAERVILAARELQRALTRLRADWQDSCRYLAPGLDEHLDSIVGLLTADKWPRGGQQDPRRWYVNRLVADRLTDAGIPLKIHDNSIIAEVLRIVHSTAKGKPVSIQNREIIAAIKGVQRTPPNS